MVVFGVMAGLVVMMWVMTWASKRFERVASGIAPLESRQFETLTLVTLGTGGTFENPLRSGPSVAVGYGSEVVLVDVGRGVAESLRAAEIPMHQPVRVFLTSLLPENTVGLDDLWLTGWLGPREAALEIYGPPGTRSLVEGLRAAHSHAFEAQAREWDLPAAGGEARVTELSGGEAVPLDELSMRSASLPGAALPTLAYRFDVEERSAVVSGSAPFSDELIALAQGAHLLVVDAVYGASLDAARETGIDGMDVLDREAARHPRLEELGEAGRRSQVHTLILTRLRPPPVFEFQYERIVESQYPGRVLIASDGLEILP